MTPMPALLLATNNAGKRREFSRLLDGIEIISPADLGLALEVDETGSTFVANATLKADAFAAAAHHIALADDSGLEVDALDGAPGVLSARYGGPGLDDEGRFRHLLDQIRTVEAPRTARFRCCLVATAPDGRTCSAEGVCQGVISTTPSGGGGFGYDPVFFLPQYDCTMAEVGAEIKNRISHRAAALHALRPQLARTFPELVPGSTA